MSTILIGHVTGPLLRFGQPCRTTLPVWEETVGDRTISGVWLFKVWMYLIDAIVWRLAGYELFKHCKEEPNSKVRVLLVWASAHKC